MQINRIGTTERWSDAVVYNQTIYLVEVATNLEASCKEQTKEVLAAVEKTLVKLGSSKSQLLSVTIYLTDRSDVEHFNQVWDKWVPAGTAPVRACLITQLVNPGFKVEVQVTAALIDKHSAGVKFMT